jgi:hypothetical protein
MRWKALFFLNPSEQRERKETFGFNSTKPSPTNIKELKEFENKMYALVNYTTCKAYKNQFQHKLKEDSTKVKGDTKM